MTAAAFWLDVVGLVIGFAGGILIFFYGVAPIIDAEGADIIVTEARENSSHELERYKLRSRIGLGMIVVAFLCQLVAKAMSL